MYKAKLNPLNRDTAERFVRHEFHRKDVIAMFPNEEIRLQMVRKAVRHSLKEYRSQLDKKSPLYKSVSEAIRASGHVNLEQARQQLKNTQ